MKNVLSLVKTDTAVDESLLENAKILMEKIEAGEVTELACVAHLKGGGIFYLTPPQQNRIYMLGAIHHLANIYANESMESP